MSPAAPAEPPHTLNTTGVPPPNPVPNIQAQMPYGYLQQAYQGLGAFAAQQQQPYPQQQQQQPYPQQQPSPHSAQQVPTALGQFHFHLLHISLILFPPYLVPVQL